jgi:putative ABC transport system ATP-binding protein
MDILVHEHKKTILMVTHDPKAAERADLTLHLDKGVLVEAEALASHP